MIAHRLSTIKDVDRIAFIAGGKVLEYGSHSELFALNGRYRRLVDTQNRHASVTAAMLRNGDITVSYKHSQLPTNIRGERQSLHSFSSKTRYIIAKIIN